MNIKWTCVFRPSISVPGYSTFGSSGAKNTSRFVELILSCRNHSSHAHHPCIKTGPARKPSVFVNISPPSDRGTHVTLSCPSQVQRGTPRACAWLQCNATTFVPCAASYKGPDVSHDRAQAMFGATYYRHSRIPSVPEVNQPQISVPDRLSDMHCVLPVRIDCPSYLMCAR